MDKKARVDKFSPSSEISPGRVGRRSRDGQSPGSILTSGTRGIRKLSPSKPSPSQQEISPRRTRRTEHAEFSPKGEYEIPRRTRNINKNYIEESEESENPEVDSPFYPSAPGPHHVRFSPSAKTSNKSENTRSPFGRKTRSSRRGLSSYIQSLPSEDEQSEFNRHYRY